MAKIEKNLPDIEELAEDKEVTIEDQIFPADYFKKDEVVKEEPKVVMEIKSKKQLEEEAKALEPEVIETMDDYKDELEASFRKISVGDVLTGTVIDVDETGVTLDLNYYAPGKIPAQEMSNDPHFELLSSVTVGEVIEATVIKRDDGRGNIVLSRKLADDTLGWEKLEQMRDEHKVITGKISEVTKGGAILYVEGIRGFIPASRLALTYVEDVSEYLHKDIQVQVIEVNQESEKLVLSAKEILTEKAVEIKNEKVKRLEVGNIVEGTVESLKDYGAFINIGDGISGLCHISQISEKRIKHPKVVLKEGQTVKVLIQKIENGKVSLSIKGANEVTAVEQVDEETEWHDDGEAVTYLGDIFKNLKF